MATIDRRTNHETAIAIAYALKLQRNLGAEAARLFLGTRGIDELLVQNILHLGYDRRRADRRRRERSGISSDI